MTREAFKEKIKELTVKRHKLMFGAKQKTYTGKNWMKNDAHGNFRRRAEDLGLSVATVIKVDMWKHWDAIEHGNLSADPDGGLESRFLDFLNYAELYYAHLVEQGLQQ